MQQKIVLIGGPGTGKTSVLNELVTRGFCCKIEISREVTLNAQAKGIDQLFLTKPILFSELLLKSRVQQFLEADKSEEALVFFDRGIPDVEAYLNYFKTAHPSFFSEKSRQYKYDKVFMFSPWEEIYTTDNERYESFEESVAINHFVENTYKKLGYTIQKVPFGNIKERANFILNSL